MKICFIWVEKYRNFENFGLNLSSEIKFEYDLKSNSLLSKKSDTNLPNDFFGKNITDITAIIGKNGAGKSNSIELICKMLKGTKTSLRTNFLLVIEDKNKFKCFYSDEYNKNIHCNIKIDFEKHDGNINNLKVVFFSNVFDERRNNFSNDISDISVNNLFKKYYTPYKNELTSFQKQIKFINSKVFELLDIQTPREIQFTLKVWRNRLPSSAQRAIYRENYELINEFRKIFRSRIRNFDIHDKFIYLFIYGFFMDTIQSYFKQSSSQNEEHKIFNFISRLLNIRSTEDITLNIIDFLFKEAKKLERNEESVFTNRYDRGALFSTNADVVFKQVDFLIELKETIKNYNLEYDIEGTRDKSLEYFTFDYSSKQNKQFFRKIIDLFEDNNIFDIDWIGISSGHKAYLNLFASLYQELRYTKSENLLLCIDEGDLYLHPKWQIEFFNKLLKVLPQIYNNNIQLVLSSHSPFLLSDLPNSNITILKDGKAINGLELKINTFGGNLYDLYSEPFFLENKRTSEFAFEKIKELINMLNNKNLTQKDKKQISIVNNILGDDIIKFKINKALESD